MARVNRFSKAFKKTKLQLSTITLSKGQFQASSLTQNRYVIERACENLQERGMMHKHGARPTTDRMAFELMCTLGYRVETSQQNYSLLDENDSVISSANTYSPQTMNMVTKNIDAQQSFPNDQDPFYEVDDSIPDKMQESNSFLPYKMAETMDLVTSGFALGNVGMRQSSPEATSRYFDNMEVKDASKRIKS